ncbi:serpin family protein [Kitasatospora phosalacinea]|uniref:Serpin family protein n=1 Tax=Kitasatospora phosalacinea TaxID=2065 RepID=A0ABW6GN85_9ACTN
MHRTVHAVNRLTARWGRTAPDDGRSTAFSAPAAWAPLALLTAGATGPAARELADALGVPTAGAAAAGRELLAALDRTPGVTAALGLWTRDRLPLEPAWTADLPPGSHRRLTGAPATDRAALDGWAAERTAGAIPRMPVTVTPDSELLLAAALTVRTDWIRRFHSHPYVPGTGPWQDRPVAGLHRRTGLLDRVGVADDTEAGPLTVLKVLGLRGVDVHLCLGPEDAAPGAVLAAAVRTAERPRLLRPGTELPDGAPGPGLTAGWARSHSREPALLVGTVEFDLTDDHDLLERPDLFGLRTATDAARGHFPGISAEPLAVDSARQTTTAVFGPRGFRAASVTAFGAVGAGIPARPPYLARRLTAEFDRPFAFLAVHRTSRLVLAAGWVADPKPPAPEPFGPEPDDPEAEW